MACAPPEGHQQAAKRDVDGRVLFRAGDVLVLVALLDSEKGDGESEGARDQRLGTRPRQTRCEAPTANPCSTIIVAMIRVGAAGRCPQDAA
jgi:hypothetical protein